MCTTYCKDESTIILCVLPANVDLSTSEALHMAMRLDPSGDRTIGVLTKLDLMNEGTSAKGILLGDEVSLKNGYIALKNRSQFDLANRLPIEEAIKKEQIYFKNHPVYRNMPPGYFGIENLVEKLRKLFFEHLKLFLPGIYSDLKEKINDCQKNLDALGTDYMIYGDPDNKMQFLNQIISKFGENVEDIFNGKSKDISENITAHRIKLSYYEFLENISDSYLPSDSTKNHEIIDIVKKTEGDRLSGFPEADVIYALLEKDFEKIKQEQLLLYDRIYEFSTSTVKTLLEKYFCRFPQLKQKLDEIVMEFVDRHYTKTKEICDCISLMNLEYLYIDEKSSLFADTLKSILLTSVNTKETYNQNVDNYYNVRLLI